METLGQTLRAHRMRAGLSQAELADRAAIGVRTVRNLEQDRVTAPRASSLRRLASALELSDADVDRLLALVGTEEGLSVAILGPLTVSRAGSPVEVGSVMLRRLLGLLALQPDRVVSYQEIVEVLWEHDPPRSYRGLIQLYIGQLRGLLEPGRARRTPGRVVAHVSGGYRLRLGPDRLDLARFDEFAGRGLRARQQGDPHTARDLLDQALACWRGPVLADLGERLRHHPVTVASARRRATAALAYAELADEPGHSERALARLRSVADENPLHEGVVARLGLALARVGEQAAALALYAEVRARLADELGIEPGAELRAAHLQVLRQQVPGDGPGAPAPVRPAQLPADAAGFTGRAALLEELDSVLHGPGEPRVVVVTGTGGVGKTALAVRWAHRVRGEFPDGQLYVDLRGFAADHPLRPIDALTGFLQSLGRDQEPADTDRAAALYRSLLADKRVLVVLDNARDAGQVRPLLPGSPGCLTLVTSRDRLSGLVARDGARRVPVDVLTGPEAASLLERLAGAGRVAEEPDAAEELVELCGRLPLALRIAGANMTGRAGGLAAHAARLRTGDRLVALATDGDEQTAVRATFDLSYAALPEAERTLFGLLGVAPGADITPEAAAALAGVLPEEAARSLDRLAGAHLVEERADGRYGLHDLLRLYAAEHAADEDAGPLFDWYLHTADAAARLLYPHMLRLPLPASPDTPGFRDHAEALRWLDAERHNLIAVVERAAARGPRPVAWQLADALHGYFWLRMYTVDWLTVAGSGLDAARAEGDPRAEAACELSLANAHMRTSQYQQAIGHANRALHGARSTDWLAGQAAAVNNLGIVGWQSGRLREAVDQLTHALALNRRTDHVHGEAANLGNLSIIYRELGGLRVAVAHVTAAMSIARRIDYPVGEANGHIQLGKLAHDLGRFDAALEQLDIALRLTRKLGNRGGEADAWCTLVKVRRDLGGSRQVRALAAETVALAAETADRQVEAGARNTLATICLRLGAREEAVEHFRQALNLAVATGNRYPEIEALIGLAGCHRVGEAAEYACQALNLSRLGGYRVLEGRALAGLATARMALRRPDQALPEAVQAVEIQRRTGHALGEAHAHFLLWHAYRATGRPGAAETALRRAASLFRRVGVPVPDDLGSTRG